MPLKDAFKFTTVWSNAAAFAFWKQRQKTWYRAWHHYFLFWCTSCKKPSVGQTDKGHHSSAIKINTFNMIRIHTYKMISVLICAGGEKNPPQ